MEHVVANLMGEDDFDFVGRESGQQRIAEQYAARAAQAGQHGVGLDRLVAKIHTIDAFDRQAGALRPAGPCDP